MARFERRWKASSLRMVIVAAWLLASGAGLAQPVEGPYMTTADVHVRKGPGTKYDIVATIPKGIRVQVVGREGYWLKVRSRHGNPPGYINDRFARALESPRKAGSARAIAGPYTITEDTSLREGPGLHFRVLARVPKGVKIHVVGADGDWLKVESKRGNPTGYIEKRFAEPEPAR